MLYKKERKMQIKIFNKKLTIKYINNYLRRKGIATYEYGENEITFKVYDINWNIGYEEGKLIMRCSFIIGKDIQMQNMRKAINTLNHERYIVKAFLVETGQQDEEDNLNKDVSSQASIVFSFEQFCFSKSAFSKIYEFAIYAMADAIDFHKKVYNNYVIESDSKKYSSQIGFNSSTKQQNFIHQTNIKQERRRIGFI